MKIKLLRDLLTMDEDENRISGMLVLADYGQLISLETVENVLHLCPTGLYLLRHEYSPKFETHLWELYGTNKRSEIKFHEGYYAKHSRGCILLGGDSLDILHHSLDNRKIYEIEIINL